MCGLVGATTEVAGASRGVEAVVSEKSFMPSIEWRKLAGRVVPMVLASEGEPSDAPPLC